MSYIGKFIDRNPTMRAAGVSKYSPDARVANCLQYISFQEELDSVIKSGPKIPEKEYPSQKLAEPNVGFETQVKHLISPTRKSFFQNLDSELKETAYASYWKQEMGGLPDQVPGLPFGMVPAQVTFGMPTVKDTTVSELVNPKKTVGEINLISELGHDLYKKTHNSYFPGEQKSFNYPNLTSPKDNVYGVRSPRGPASSVMQEAIRCRDMRDSIIGPQNLALFKQHYTPKVGRCTSKNDYLLMLPEGFAFGGKKVHTDFSVEDCLRTCEISDEKRKITNSLSYVTKLRDVLKDSHPSFSLVDFASAFRNVDEKKCDCLPQELFYKICEEEGLKLNRDMIEPFIKRVGIMHGKTNLVNYHRFTRLLDVKHNLPDIGKVEDIPEDLKLFGSTYQLDYLGNLGKTKETERIPRAGSPVGALQYRYPYLRKAGLIKADLNSFPSTTRMENCLSPGLFLSLGVSHRDFFQPRSKEYIRDIYERIGVALTDEIFEKLWEEAIRRDGKRVCLETFRNILDEVTTIKLVFGTKF